MHPDLKARPSVRKEIVPLNFVAALSQRYAQTEHYGTSRRIQYHR